MPGKEIENVLLMRTAGGVVAGAFQDEADLTKQLRQWCDLLSPEVIAGTTWWCETDTNVLEAGQAAIGAA